MSKINGFNESEDAIYQIGYEQGRTDAIKEFANRLLNNEVIDKSVIRRVAEQMQKGVEKL